MTSNPQPGETGPRPGRWATNRQHLEVTASESGGDAGAVAGRRIAGPVQGFGKLWQKTYSVRVPGTLLPEHVVAEWRDHYGEFWPRGNHFHAPLSGVEPGEVALISGRTGGTRCPRVCSCCTRTTSRSAS